MTNSGDAAVPWAAAVVAVLLVGLLGACSDAPTGPPAAGQRDSLEFSFVPVDTGPRIFDPAPITARGAEGTIEIDGFVVARCDTWAIRAGLTRDDAGYRLRLFYRLLSDFCNHAVRHRWHARIVGVPAGTHRVSVRQPVLASSGAFVVVTVLETDVVVLPPPGPGDRAP